MWFLLLVIVVLILLYLSNVKPVNFPPGPKWYPIIGNMWEIYNERIKNGMLCKAIMCMAKKYRTNRVIGLKVGKDKIVVAIESDAILEMVRNEDLDGRPFGPFFTTRTWGLRRGIILVDELFWQEQRRFIMRHLKEFGFARRGMIEIIQNECEHLLSDFKMLLFRQNGDAMVSMCDAFSIYVLNTLWTMMAGIRYNQENKEVQHLQRMLNTLFTKVDMVGAPFSHFPFLRFLAPHFSGYTQFKDIHEMLYKFLGRELENHKQHFKIDNEPKDLMDVYLQAINSTQTHNDSFSEKQLLAICLDMFVAGSDTTNKSMGFLMLHLIRNPDIQTRMQEEIDRVIGRNRLPTLEDRAKMPFCEASVLEGIRMFMGYTFGVPHRALRDTKLCGFNIPKDTMVVPCFYGMAFDKTIWPDSDPEMDCFKFCPDRFIKNGKIHVPERHKPFGAGKHRCIGELMARANIFLFTTTLLQNFCFQIPPGYAVPTSQPVDGVTAGIQQYTARVLNR
ncbi:probable cytochrome P450 303a1 [Contarinia nasturtii]|uniref:probable cytochrome P450 303a1 n=1 Tax=Contarinia nasturtii TaxID=265458 RepID=UPI0012D3BBD7|nr:probable cytochrome P450 303a1 [Contarinia nasturtii]